MSMSSAGRAENSNGCVTRPKGREIGLSGFAAQIQLCSLTGSYVMATAKHREPYESRGSRTVLGARGGEIPPRDSTPFFPLDPPVQEHISYWKGDVMSQASIYPPTRYEPSPLIDLASKNERARLSPAAVRTFFKIMARWRIRDEDARLLLGGMSNGPFYQTKKNPERVLDTDRLTRISYLIGIFKALNILYSDKLADNWVQLPNKNRIFNGQPPLSYMVKGGIPAMQTVRRLLDARRGGM